MSHSSAGVWAGWVVMVGNFSIGLTTATKAKTMRPCVCVVHVVFPLCVSAVVVVWVVVLIGWVRCSDVEASVRPGSLNEQILN